MNTLGSLFKEIELPTPREGLEGRIVRAVFSARDRDFKRRLAVSYAGLFLSGMLLLYASIAYGSTLLGSEFWSVIALLFSDARAVASYWNEFVLLLLETIPVVPILLVLVPIFIFLMFLGLYFKTRERRHHFSY